VLVLGTSFAPASACDPSIEDLARDTLERAGALLFDCPESLRSPRSEERSICATLDEGAESFLDRWNAEMLQYRIDGDETSDATAGTRTYRIDRTDLVLRVRGGAVALVCTPAGTEATTESTAEPAPAGEAAAAAPADGIADDGQPAAPEQVVDPPSLRDVARRALAATGAAVFFCPDSLRERYAGQGIVCAFYDGTFEEFAEEWALPEGLATPTAEWTAAHGAHERLYDVDGRTLKVRLNNGAAAVTFDLPAEAGDVESAGP
jgi:hypothetical protein